MARCRHYQGRDRMAGQDWQLQFDKAQSSRTANVVCMKWGKRYGPGWVNRLFAMVKRHSTWNVRFVCFTDDATGIRPEVECQPLPEVRFDAARIGKYWPKLGLMREGLGGLEGMTLFLDLDVVIVDSIDDLFTYPGRFLIIREWKDPELGYGNSSVVRYFIGAESAVLDRFYATSPEEIVSRYKSKEQNFLTKAVDEATFWPADWVPAFSIACLPANRVARFFSTPKPPAGAKIIVFYGSITPESAIHGVHEAGKRIGRKRFVPLLRRRFGPATWIADHWRE
jgi:hypothetical protein